MYVFCLESYVMNMGLNCRVLALIWNYDIFKDALLF